MTLTGTQTLFRTLLIVELDPRRYLYATTSPDLSTDLDHRQRVGKLSNWGRGEEIMMTSTNGKSPASTEIVPKAGLCELMLRYGITALVIFPCARMPVLASISSRWGS